MRNKSECISVCIHKGLSTLMLCNPHHNKIEYVYTGIYINISLFFKKVHAFPEMLYTQVVNHWYTLRNGETPGKHFFPQSIGSTNVSRDFFIDYGNLLKPS